MRIVLVAMLAMSTCVVAHAVDTINTPGVNYTATASPICTADINDTTNTSPAKCYAPIGTGPLSQPKVRMCQTMPLLTCGGQTGDCNARKQRTGALAHIMVMRDIRRVQDSERVTSADGFHPRNFANLPECYLEQGCKTQEQTNPGSVRPTITCVVDPLKPITGIDSTQYFFINFDVNCPLSDMYAMYDDMYGEDVTTTSYGGEDQGGDYGDGEDQGGDYGDGENQGGDYGDGENQGGDYGDGEPEESETTDA